MNKLLWIICLVYCISPVDFFPGPVDDVIVTFVAAGLSYLLSGKNNGKT